MTEQQVACSSISLSPKKQKGQPRGQAELAMPRDGIIPHGAWRIQLKKKHYTGHLSSVLPVESPTDHPRPCLKDGTCSLALAGAVPSAGSWSNANHPIPWMHYTLHPKTAQPCSLFYTVLFPPANLERPKHTLFCYQVCLDRSQSGRIIKRRRTEVILSPLYY